MLKELRKEIRSNGGILMLSFLIAFYYILSQNMAISLNFILLLQGLRKGIKFNTWTPIAWFGTFFLFVFLDATFRDVEFRFVMSCFNILVMLFTLLLYVREHDDVDRFLKYTSVAGLFFCLYITNYYNSYFGVGRLGMELPGTRIDSAITLGYILLYFACTQLYAMFSSKNFFFTVSSYLSFIFCLYLIILTGTRKALIIPFILLFVLLAIKYRKNIFKFTFFGVAFVLFIILAFEFVITNEIMSEVQFLRLQGLLGFVDANQFLDESSEERVMLAQRAMEFFLDNPVLGYGVDNTYNTLGKHAHNNYLSTLCFGGIVMFLLYYWIYIKFIRRIRHFTKADYGKLLVIVIVALPLSDVGTTSFNVMYFNILISLLLIDTCKPKKRNTTLWKIRHARQPWRNVWQVHNTNQ